MKRRKAKKMCECGTLIKVEGTDCVFMSLGFVRNGCIDSFNGIDIRKRELISRCSGKGRLATKKESLIYWSVMKEYLAGMCKDGIERVEF